MILREMTCLEKDFSTNDQNFFKIQNNYSVKQSQMAASGIIARKLH